MYVYQIYFEENGVYDFDFSLVHDKQYTNDEFQSMCKGAKKLSDGRDSVYNLLNHLIDKYGFKNINDLKVASYKGVR